MSAGASAVVPPPAAPTGQWTGWSACTQPCGGLQKRMCLTGSDCDGPSMQFCNLLAQCPRMSSEPSLPSHCLRVCCSRHGAPTSCFTSSGSSPYCGLSSRKNRHMTAAKTDRVPSSSLPNFCYTALDQVTLQAADTHNCWNMAAPDHGFIIPTSAAEGETVTFSCQPGYTLAGDSATYSCQGGMLTGYSFCLGMLLLCVVWTRPLLFASQSAGSHTPSGAIMKEEHCCALGLGVFRVRSKHCTKLDGPSQILAARY